MHLSQWKQGQEKVLGHGTAWKEKILNGDVSKWMLLVFNTMGSWYWDRASVEIKCPPSFDIKQLLDVGHLGSAFILPAEEQ